MKSRRHFLFTLGAVLGTPACWTRSAVLSCAKCGYEYTAGQAFCSHCGAPLAPAAVAQPDPAALAAATPAASGGAVSKDSARKVEQLARQAAANGAPVAAFLLARQADALAAAAGEAELARAMEQFGREQGDLLRLGTKACPACKGNGRRLMLFANFAGDVHEQSTPNMPCPYCAGRGTVRTQMNDVRLKARLSEGQRNVDSLLRSIRYGDAGGVWVPEAIAADLPPRQQALLRTTFARPCSSCGGYGTFGCETCEGSGRQPCSGEGCVMGQTICPDCGGKRRVTSNETGHAVQQTCRTCRQTGIVNCKTCAGRGWIACENCTGQGTLNCKACLGRGETAACTKCEGRGVTDCRTCRGAGEIRGAPCTTCKGGKVTLCTSCSGYGRRRR